MNKLYVNLNIINDISLFVQAATQVQEKIYLKSGKYTVDAKSIMGIYSLNLSQPVLVEIEANEFPKTFLKQIENFIVK